MAKYDVVTMGSGLVDALLHTKFTEDHGNIHLSVGTKIKVDGITFSIGGGGINTASCLSKLGLKTGFLGKVGQGNNGGIIKRELKKRKVDFLGVKTKEHTGYSIILETDKNHRTILTYKGASNRLKFSEVDLKKLKTKWIHFTSMADGSFETQKKIVDYACRNNIKISFNPSSYQTKKGVSYISKLVRNSYFLSMNKEEAKHLVKSGNLFKRLHKLGPEIVCITNGQSEGGIYDGKFLYRYWPSKIKIHACTGAGDTFSSSFIAGLLKTNDIEKSLRVAMANSEALVTNKRSGNTKYGGVLTWREVQKVLKTRKFKIKKEVI